MAQWNQALPSKLEEFETPATKELFVVKDDYFTSLISFAFATRGRMEGFPIPGC